MLARHAWWKLVVLTVLYAWLSLVNHWFTTSFFVAIAFGVIVGRIVPRTLYRANVLLSVHYVTASAITAAVCLYVHFALYCSFCEFNFVVLPWQIWDTLRWIAAEGTTVSGYIIAEPIAFEGSGYYLQWTVESVMAVTASGLSAHFGGH